jgi:hypothetical protein
MIRVTRSTRYIPAWRCQCGAELLPGCVFLDEQRSQSRSIEDSQLRCSVPDCIRAGRRQLSLEEILSNPNLSTPAGLIKTHKPATSSAV